MKFLPSIFIISLLSALVFAEDKTITISEAVLVEQLKKSSPDLEQIMGDYAQNVVNYQQILNRFQLSLNGSADLFHSNEKSINSQTPTTEKMTRYSVGINKPTSFGVDLGVAYTANKTTSNLFQNETTAKFTGNAKIDLYKNFLGRLNRSEIKEAHHRKKAAHLLQKIYTEQLILQLRGLYWDYVGANESLKVSQRLLKSAQEQVEDVRKRRRSEVADDGDVARFKSQESERKAQSYQFQANKKIVESNFRELLPAMSGHNIKLAPYDIDNTVKQFYSCLDTIAAQKETPYHFSLMDDVIALLEQEYAHRQKVTAAINRPQVAFVSEAGVDGKDFGYGKANNRADDPGDEFYSVGIQLEVPLDTRSTKAERAQAELDRHRFNAETLKFKSQMTAFHETVVEAVGLLRDVVLNRLENSKYLDVAVKDSRRKYRQARMTSQQLIDEESSYLSNQLNLIDLEVQIIKVMFDYFALFTETPCELNQVSP